MLRLLRKDEDLLAYSSHYYFAFDKLSTCLGTGRHLGLKRFASPIRICIALSLWVGAGIKLWHSTLVSIVSRYG